MGEAMAGIIRSGHHTSAWPEGDQKSDHFVGLCYADYVAGVRHEYAHVPEQDFRRGRAAVLRDLAAAPALFRTAEGRERWEEPARRNLTAELTELTGS